MPMNMHGGMVLHCVYLQWLYLSLRPWRAALERRMSTLIASAAACCQSLW